MRYFIVTYSANDKKGASLSGMATSVVNEGYLNEKSFREDACEKQDLKTLTITNIIELNESDYNDFTKK